MTAAANKEAMRRIVTEVWNEKNYDTFEELYSPDFVSHWFEGSEDGTRDDLLGFIQDVHQGFPDYEMAVEFVHAEDDLVTVGLTSTGTHQGELNGNSTGGHRRGRPRFGGSWPHDGTLR